MKHRARFTLLYYALIFLFFSLIDVLFFGRPEVPEVSYRQFRDAVAAGRVEQVVITDDRIYGLLRPATGPGAAAPDGSATATGDSVATTTGDSVATTTGDSVATTTGDSVATTTGDSVATTTATRHAAVPDSSADTQHSPPLVVHKAPTPWRLKWKHWDDARQADPERTFTVLPLHDPGLIDSLQAHGVDYRGRVESHWLSHVFFNWIIPFGILFLVWGALMRRMAGGSSFLQLGKSKAKIYAVDASERVTFRDVAGIDEAVEEVQEVVDFLSHPTRYTRLGAKLPKGLLLVGPPGTGKTLLARAVAGEAGVPFFSLSGSDFVEMFVGLGAARVRDLFEQAKLKAPCIIFIDELDAVGKSRGQGALIGGHDERENTLNQLLTEMDGFDPRAGIIIMAATNRPEVLDPALLRPGRFDRQILVDRPDLYGRQQILALHSRGLPLDSQVDLHDLAAQTPGFAGAELANLCNEAALLASRRGHELITSRDFQDAIERIIGGLEKKNKLINPHEREIVAYHEAGHAIVGHFTPGADPVKRISIVPRGIGALGYTMQTPIEDRYLMTRSELVGKVRGLLGGRAAELVVFGEVSTGASDDLERASKIVRDMITVYGMSEQLPNLSLVDRRESFLPGTRASIGEHSEQLEQTIDLEMMRIFHESFDAARQVLTTHRKLLDELARALLAREKLGAEEILDILGPRHQEATRGEAPS